MTGILAVDSVAEASATFSWARLWELVDGDEHHLNITHECLDRHARDAVAARVATADGRIAEHTFGELSDATSRFAHLLEARGIAVGEPVGILMDPSLDFYTALFGTIKRGAVAVPLYTLFGPESVQARVGDCGARYVVAHADAARLLEVTDAEHLVFDEALTAALNDESAAYEPTTSARDRAVLQYTSGTTRAVPTAVVHDHRAVVTLLRAAIFALGLRPDDRYLCPSHPAWGHGLWHGTIAPWALGVAVGAYAGRFDIDRLVDVLRDLRIDNLAAASTVYRMLLSSGRARELTDLRKASYTGEDLDAAAQQDFLEHVGVPVCGMYGTTETGVIIVNFPGFRDHTPRPGALGRPMPGAEVAVIGADDEPVPADVPGEIAVKRRGRWFRSKDLGTIDRDGYFHYGGRADDVIIASGWTINPLEVERTLAAHPDVREVAVIGVPDATRGQIVAAYVIAEGTGTPELAEQLQQRVREQLGAHEYPRRVAFVDDLPRTPNGKIDRRSLRAAARTSSGAGTHS